MNRKLLTTVVGASILASTLSPAYAANQDVIHLSWNGKDYTSTIGESFVGTPVTVPGDSAERTLKVKNNGPSDGEMRVSIINVDTKGKDDPDQGNFYKDLKLSWKTESGEGSEDFYDLKSNSVIGQYHVAKGEVSDVTIGYDFPVESTSGNTSKVNPRLASFDVLVEIGGDLPDEPVNPTLTPTGGTTPKPSSSTPGTSPSQPNRPDKPGELTAISTHDGGKVVPVPSASTSEPKGVRSETGEEAKEDSRWPIIVVGVGALILAAGLVATLLIRRRKGK